MRISYLATSPLPSTEANGVHVMKMSNAFAALGHEVQLIARRGDGSLDELHSRYGTSGFAVEIVDAPAMRGARPWLLARAARGFVRSFRPDAIYGRDPHGLLLCRSLDVPFGYEMHQLAYGRRARLERRLLRSRSFVAAVFITHALEADYLSTWKWLQTRRRLVLPDGADEQPQPSRGQPRSRLRVGYVGSLYRGRGLELVVELAKRMRGADFSVVGGALEDLARLCPDAREVPNLGATGYVVPAQVAEHLRRLDIALAPYRSNLQTARGGTDTSRWMSPLKLFEYMAHGLAIVASDLPALREVLVHDRNALLADPEDVEDWVGALRRLEADPALRERLGLRAWTDITERYSWKRRAGQIIEALGAA